MFNAYERQWYDILIEKLESDCKELHERYRILDEGVLATVRREFEDSFHTKAIFGHPGRYPYVEVTPDGVKAENLDVLGWRPTVEEAVSDWKKAMRQFEGRGILYWARDGAPSMRHDPQTGMWSVYARFWTED